MGKSSKRYFKVVLLSFSLLTLMIGQESQSASLTYTPTSSSISDDLFNSSYLVGLAEIQNRYAEDRSLSIGSAGLSQPDLFVRSFRSRLLSALAGPVNDAIHGETPLESGTILFGDVTVDFRRGLEFVGLTISDASTDLVTEVSVPIFQDLP